MQIEKYTFHSHGDERGQLIAIEAFKDIPFDIKRVYYIYGMDAGVRRGFHAHKSLEQILICIHGSCKVMLDDGKEKKTIHLERPYEGLYVSNAMWREMLIFLPMPFLLCLRLSSMMNRTIYGIMKNSFSMRKVFRI